MTTVKNILEQKLKPLISVSPDTKIYNALEVMVKNKLGSIVVEENNEILGIWTERDLMRSCLTTDFDIHSALIKDYMTTDLRSIDENKTLNTLIDRFASLNCRHLLVKRENTYIGVISSVDAIRGSLQDKNKKYKELNSFVSWEYYEKWDR